MKTQTYKQCCLSKPVEGGTAYMHSWIRSEIAMPGQVLDKLEDSETGVWEFGWKVKLLIHRSHRTNVFGSLEANRTPKETRQCAQ
jgi:hypothetical protein